MPLVTNLSKGTTFRLLSVLGHEAGAVPLPDLRNPPQGRLAPRALFLRRSSAMSSRIGSYRVSRDDAQALVRHFAVSGGGPKPTEQRFDTCRTVEILVFGGFCYRETLAFSRLCFTTRTAARFPRNAPERNVSKWVEPETHLDCKPI